MPLKLVLGPANAAKAGEVLGAYGAAARRGGLLVVPTVADVEHYTRELAGEGALLGRVLTFGALAREIARRAGYGGVPMSALQRERVLRRVLDRASFVTLRAVADAPGFAAAAGALIAELQRALVTPQRFARALEQWAAAAPRRAVQAGDLGALYQAYARELDRTCLLDAELFAWRALDALRSAPGRWGVSPVCFYGFDDLLGTERDAVETLARVVGVPVLVSLTYEQGRAALSARAGVVEELRAIADEVLELPARDDYYAPASRVALHRLERGLFEHDGAGVDPGPAVRLLESGGERAEAELIAAEVLSLLGEGFDAEQIVVVCRSLRRTAPLLERVFARYGIPVCGERRIPLTHTALGRSVLALARCACPDGGAGAEELLVHLRAPGRLERPEVADGLELEVRKRGLISAEEARAALGWRLGELDALRHSEHPAAELARQARALFAAPHRAAAPLLDTDQLLDARALAALCAALDELEELGERLALSELPELLETLQLPAGAPARAGAVLLAEPLGIRARRFRAVLVCGLCEGEFPSPPAVEPFLSDELRRELASASGLALALGEDALATERYLFYNSVSRGTERVLLSYRSSDEEGNLVLPSPFLADVAELLFDGWPERRRRRLLADVVWPLAQAPTERERARALAAGGNGERAPAGPDGGAIQLPARALAHVRHREVVSGGALESFAQCPVRWLIEKQLSPDSLEPDADALSRGSFMHAVLERLLRRLGGPITPQTLPAAQRLLSEILAQAPPDDDREPVQIGVGRGPSVRAAMRLSIEADLRRYLAREASGGSDWGQFGLELRFGFADSLPPVKLGDGDQRVLLRGVIDRVDVDGGEAIVRDYKSGSARAQQRGARWSEDRQLQVALYMLAVRRLLGLDPVAGFYQPLGGGNLQPRGIFLKGAAVGAGVSERDGRERAELDEQLDDAERLAVQLAGRLRAGRLEPCPQTCSRGGCQYPGICRSS